MRPDRAIRLVFSAASAVGRATGTQPDTVGAALQQITAAVESACQRVSVKRESLPYSYFACPSLLLLSRRPGNGLSRQHTGWPCCKYSPLLRVCLCVCVLIYVCGAGRALYASSAGGCEQGPDSRPCAGGIQLWHPSLWRKLCKCAYILSVASILSSHHYLF